jgi:hypothetical protein
MRCTAKAKRSGEQCRNWAKPGLTVCPSHGVTGNGARKADERLTLAQLLSADPRHPWQVIIDATATLDAIMRSHRVEILAGETITVDQLDRLIQYSQAAHHMATVAISTKAHEQLTVAVTKEYELQGKLVGAALGAAIDALGLSDVWRQHALAIAAWKLRDDPEDAKPQPPTDPVIREYDVAPVDAPALEAAPCVPTVDDLARLDDDVLRALGYGVADELDRRGIDG